ncbi:somatostatin receptor type 5-like [Spea bombifrons]|uniref:somatostatin receptor type 5-like n=1 Tax=Spea bombifrons TaxID=233779 RepID=UPI002349CE49|nr:somatostatin receptor type 5-like [Spea bombifrons]
MNSSMDYFPEDLDLDLDLDYWNFSDFNISDYGDQKNPALFSAFYVLVCLVGLVGNALAVYVVLRHRHMWSAINIYVFNIALGDLVYMLCLLLFAVETAHSFWPMGVFLCRVFWALSTLISFSSIYFLVIMSISECVRAYFPVFSVKKLGLKAALVISICTWVICLLLGIPFFMYAYVDSFNSCKIWSEPSTIWSIAITCYQLVMTFAWPLLLICISLILTAGQVRAQKNMADSPQASAKEGVVLVFGLTLVYVIIWLPMNVLEIMSALGAVKELSMVTYYLLSIVPYLKCCVYPIMYGFLSPSFKECFMKVLCCSKAEEAGRPPECSTEKHDEKSLNC